MLPRNTNHSLLQALGFDPQGAGRGAAAFLPAIINHFPGPFPEPISECSLSVGCGGVNGRDLAHAGAAAPFPGVGQIKRRLWGFSPTPTGPSGEGFWTARRCGLSSGRSAHFSTGALRLCARRWGCEETPQSRPAG